MRQKLILLLILGASQSIYSQNDSLHYTSVYESKPIKKADELILNGKVHINYPNSIEGVPYYLSKEWLKGSIDYQGAVYKDVTLAYDLVANEVVVRHQNGYTGVVLFTPRIESFSIADKLFVNIREDGPSIKPGLYELLSKGKLTLIVRRSKVLTESIVSNVLERKFVDVNTFYMLKEGVYHPIKKQKTAMELVGDKKDAINAKLKASGQKFKDNPEAALLIIVGSYNQLSL